MTRDPRMSSRLTTMPISATRRAMAATALLLWLLATCLLAVSPLLYFVSGASDGAIEADRIRFAAMPALMAWPLLVLAVGLALRRQGRAMGLLVAAAAGRALLLMLFAGAVLALARHLGTAVAIRGDAAWTLFWTAATVAWVALSAALVRRPSAHR
jgi:hypothetical protein